ncbi:unnamed protein product, partial [Phaeothamnion confervicola]
GDGGEEDASPSYQQPVGTAAVANAWDSSPAAAAAPLAARRAAVVSVGAATPMPPPPQSRRRSWLWSASPRCGSNGGGFGGFLSTPSPYQWAGVNAAAIDSDSPAVAAAAAAAAAEARAGAATAVGDMRLRPATTPSPARRSTASDCGSPLALATFCDSWGGCVHRTSASFSPWVDSSARQAQLSAGRGAGAVATTVARARDSCCSRCCIGPATGRQGWALEFSGDGRTLLCGGAGGSLLLCRVDPGAAEAALALFPTYRLGRAVAALSTARPALTGCGRFVVGGIGTDAGWGGGDGG